MATPLRLLPLIVLSLVLAACGVIFRADFDGTEVFRRLEIEGERTAGSELTVRIEVQQGYPVPLRIGCFYENTDDLTGDQRNLVFQERAVLFGERVLPPAPDGRPWDKDRRRQTLTFRFTPPRAGEYFVACATPAAPENGLGRALTIRD